MRANVYIRAENEETWNSIPNKSEWLNNHLTPLPSNSKPIKQKQEPKNILEPKLSFETKQSFKPKQSFEAKPIITEIEKDFDFCKNGHPMKGDKCFGKGCKYN